MTYDHLKNKSKDQLIKIILKTNRCTKFIVAHNHPTGNLQPSKPDLVLTKRIKEGAELLSLLFLDHIIFSKFKHLSFQEENLF